MNTLLKLDHDLVPIDSVTEPLKETRYIEGAIIWRIGRDTLLSERDVDLVDQLWAYVVDGALESARTGRSEKYFPDQPVELIFCRTGDKVEVTVGSERHVVPYGLFHSSLKEGGNAFFSRMRLLVPEARDTWDLYLERLAQLSPPSSR